MKSVKFSKVSSKNLNKLSLKQLQRFYGRRRTYPKGLTDY